MSSAQVTVTVLGTTGTGKSRILAEIEVALKAAGCPVKFATIGDQRAAEAEHWALSSSQNGPVVAEWPTVILQEVNVTRPTTPATENPDG